MQNYKTIYAMKSANEKRILQLCPNMKHESGIYVWHRVDEEGYGRFYAGQSIDLLGRNTQHLLQYDHLGLSIRKHGLKSTTRPYGWELEYFTCKANELNDLEQKTIREWLSKGMIPYNITGGSQGVGKTDINERQPTKNYHDGLKQGYSNAMRDIKVFFDKYLDYSIKDKTNKIKERKYQEFTELLGKGEENV